MEVLVVITIILILAALVLANTGLIQDKQKDDRARTQIKWIEKALEDYKLDNGNYPSTTDSSTGAANTNILFKALYWDGVSDTSGASKIYLQELDPSSNKQKWMKGTGATATIIDPWGNEYRYRTATDSAGKANGAAQNPDFDLWSAGKNGRYNDSDIQHADNQDDIRNF